MPHISDALTRTVVSAIGVLLLGLPANALTISDDFNSAHDYAFGTTAGTTWSGMYNLPGLISNGGQFAATSGTLHIEDNGINIGWESNRSTAPFLYHTVPGGQDFTATVKVVAQTSGMWSTAGIIARAASGTPPGTGTDHADENFVTMTSFRMNAGEVNEGGTLMKRVQNGAQLSDVLSSINGSMPTNIAPLPILLRLERIGGGATYRGFVSKDGGATWQFQSRVRPDAGNPLRTQLGVPAIPMEVGLGYMNFSLLAGEAQLDDFFLETYAPKPAPGTPNIGNARSLNITATRGDLVVVDGFRDLSGLNTESMSWQLIADPLNPATPSNTTTIRVTPAVLPGAQGGETATVDGLGAPLPVDLPQDGSALFRWNTNVSPRPMMTAQPWGLGTYKWTLRATNDWLQTSNDLTLTITLIDEPPGVPGDYNNDDTVDAADYAVWRDNLGRATSLPNDDTPGVGADDYDRWKVNFGQAGGGGAGQSASVPEPSLHLFVQIALLLGIYPYRRRPT